MVETLLCAACAAGRDATVWKTFVTAAGVLVAFLIPAIGMLVAIVWKFRG